MSNHLPRPLGAACRGTVLLLASLSASHLAQAAHPASSELAVPAQPGAQVVYRLTGTIPASSGGRAACLTPGQFDAHSLNLSVPANAYQHLAARLVATVSATGSSAALTDVVVSLVRPDGRIFSADGGVVRPLEQVAITQPPAGVYQLRVCAVSGATPQNYQAELRISTTPQATERAFFATGNSVCEPPAQSLKFEQNYIDTSRAGGEPFIKRHPDGHLLWGSHAGTTHFYAPAAASPATAAFAENYLGQTYYYVAETDTQFQSWRFVPRQGPGPGDVAPVAGLPATGFSDPEFAIDEAGNVYISEINLANVAVSKSTDGGRSYGLQNILSFTVSDRQWMAADRENELYMAAAGFGGGPFPSTNQGNLGHFIAKSTDGGVTFGDPLEIDPIIGDLQIDKSRGILYSLHHAGGTLSMARFPNIRNEATAFTVEIFPIAEGTGMSGVQRAIDPTFDLDDLGNLYVTWYENGTGLRPQGVYYAYSTNQGANFTTPQRVDPSEEDEVWPWIAVGAPGQVAIAWLQTNIDSDDPLPGEAGSGTPVDRLQAAPDKPWQVVVAHSSSGLGCTDTSNDPAARLAAFTVVQASDEPPHTGTICQQGTICQAQLIDRRLGDYFSIEVAGDGSVHIAMADTRQGGGIALPLHIRQIDGPRLNAVPPPAPRTTPLAPVVSAAASEDRGGAIGPWWLLSLLLIALAGRRRRD